MKTTKKLLFKLFLMGLILTSKNANNGLLAAYQEPGSLTVKKSRDFIITGDGRSDNWKSTEWINMAQQGTDQSVYETKAKVLYSETGIYFLFNCTDKKLTSDNES